MDLHKEIPATSRTKMGDTTENGMISDEDLAEVMKKKGNAYFERKEYSEALRCYSRAITKFPSCAVYYCNRATTYMKLDKYTEALHDAQRAVSLDDQLVKAHLREAKCQLALGSADAAIRALQIVTNFKPNDTFRSEHDLIEMEAKTVQMNETSSSKAYHDGDFEKVVSEMDRALVYSPASAKFKMRRAEALFILGRFSEGHDAVNALQSENPEDADALYVQGLGAYYLGNIEMALQYLQKVFDFIPDHSRARVAYKTCKEIQRLMDQCNEFYESGKLQEVLHVLTLQLSINPDVTKAKLYGFRAEVQAKLGLKVEAIEDCIKAFQLNAKLNVPVREYLNVFRCRAKCYMDLKKYEEAVRDYKTIYDTDQTEKSKHLLREAEKKLKKSKGKDHYQTLGIQRNAGKDDIKNAFKEKALLHHPDRHHNKTPEVLEQEKLKYQDVDEAYRVLSDPKKKQMYDQKLTNRK